MITYPGLMNILGENEAISAIYGNGEVTSSHRLAHQIGELNIAGDKYEPRFCLRTPIDGYGNPAIYLELMRLVCLNGAVAMSSAFRTEIPLGKSDKGDVEDAVTRMIQTYSNDEGFAAVATRIEQAAKSWASIHEARSLYEVLNKTCPYTVGLADMRLGTEFENMYAVDVPKGKEERAKNMDIHSRFGALIGDMTKVYGLTQLNALSERKASTLPVICTVNDMINFATEVATHHVKGPLAKSNLQGWVGTTLSKECDLEGSKTQCPEFKDFFLAKPDKPVEQADSIGQRQIED
jgi:hypothetical protein